MANNKSRLVLSDFILSFMWVCSGVLIKIFVLNVLKLGRDPIGEVIKVGLAIVAMFVFALLGKVSGGAWNPLNVLAAAISRDFSFFLFTVGVRIPAQVLGSILGIKYMIETFPEIGRGPRLLVEIHHGALTEGVLTFAIVTLSLGLARKIPGNFFMKTWISSVSKITLSILGSDLTGGCMNPAAVMGWAYTRGDHITKEHLIVYWLAPIKATVLAVLTFGLVVKPLTEEKAKAKAKAKSE